MMASFNSPSQFIISFLTSTFMVLSLSPHAAAYYHAAKASECSIDTPTSSYLIHTDNLTRPSHFPTQAHWYSSIIQSAMMITSTNYTSHQRSRIFYTYDTVMHGFAATLTPQEAERVSRTDGVIGVYNDSIIHLQTTRSPDFVGLNLGDNLWTETASAEDVIIGLVDSGIWPESPAFDDDDGLPPVPPQWRGECTIGPDFNRSSCNKKLIGARFFHHGRQARRRDFDDKPSEFLSPRDISGHGTHTASTAAGSAVTNANLLGFANGTARGMASRARLAMYKACWEDIGCASSDVMAAMDAAIKDGVHILSLSIGAGPEEFSDDIIAIGAFAAMRNGIFVACAGGNSGPYASTISNGAPWITTVGASSIDRRFPARIALGNGEAYIAESLYMGRTNNTGLAPLVRASTCSEPSTWTQTVKGKILVCEYDDYTDIVDVGMQVDAAGGVGLVELNGPYQGEGIIVRPFTLPALTLGHTDAKKLVSYMNSTSVPKASLEFSYETVVGESRAPRVSFFSSRGPHTILPEILKPDVVAPGVNIIASWPTRASLMGSSKDRRTAGFNIISGTSMSCPHVAGIAALLRAAHPQWSPAMIRSSIMTTASALDNSEYAITLEEDLKPATPVAMGAGLVSPVRTRDPGLVYDAGVQDYVDLLCTMNYTQRQLRRFMPGPVSCSKFEGGVGDFNYPSFVVMFNDDTDVKTLRRSLTKVSELPETYEARVVNPRPDRVEVSVEPKMLEFGGAGEKLSYKVQFRSKVADSSSKGMDEMEYGYIIWESVGHTVKSPVVFMWKRN